VLKSLLESLDDQTGVEYAQLQA